MADEASILRVAEHERDLAGQALAEHLRRCTAAPRECSQRDSLEAHLARTQRQVELLLSADAGMDVMF